MIPIDKNAVEAIADRIAATTTADIDDRVSAAFRLCLVREPSSSELSMVREYVKKHGLANACRLLINTNEFMFVD